MDADAHSERFSQFRSELSIEIFQPCQHAQRAPQRRHRAIVIAFFETKQRHQTVARKMASAVEATGGHYSNFTGDGLMALFGLEESDDYGAMAALRCALRMLTRLEDLNRQLASELAEPLRVGIGVHTGEAIIGQMGPPKTPILTALGDAVNTAARLEGSTKELNAPIAISADALKATRLKTDLPVHNLVLRGRSDRLPVVGFDAQSLADLLDVAVQNA